MIKKYFKYLLTFIVIGLGIINFSNSGYVEYGQAIEQWGDNYCRIGNNLSISCTKSSILLTSYDPGYNKSVNSLFRSSEGIGFYYKSSSQTYQGVISTGFFICSGDFTNYTNTGTLLSNNCGGYTKINIGSYENLVNLLSSSTPKYVGTYYPDGYGILLNLVYDNFYFSESFGGWDSSYPSNGDYVLVDMGVRGQDYNTLTYGSLVLQSPFVTISNNIPVDGVIGDLYGSTIYNTCTNFDALQLMRYKYGFDDIICYGGLDSFDIFSGDNYQVIPGSGLTVFDMYNYSSGFYNNFYDWFNSYEWNYAFPCGQGGLCVDNPAIFTTYFDILVNSSSPSSSKDVLSYCDLVLNQSLTGNLLDNHNISSSIKKEVCKRNIPDNTLNNSGNSVGEDLSGIGNIENVNNSGEVVSGKNIVDGTNFINTYINLLKKSFYIDKTNNKPGVIPGYIVAFFLCILLLRFLRK